MRTIAYPSAAFDRLARASGGTPEPIRRAVSGILDAVKRRGDVAVVDFTRRFDGVRMRPSQIRVSEAVLRRARASRDLSRAAEATLREVVAFARAQLPRDWRRQNGHGASVGEKFDPLGRVGVYIPGGSVPLVSTVFMTVAIARVAGVRGIAVCTPPPVSEELLWALNRCGVGEVHRVGGAQAMAAMAYGTRTIRPVDKLFGPGNAYVTEAKRQLFGVTGVDLLAGPSELMVLADETTHVGWAALDLLAQAEHGSGRERVFCVSASRSVLRRIAGVMAREARSHAANRGLQKVLKGGTWFVHARNREAMIAVVNALAPEHLQIMARGARALAGRITTAGGIFIGNRTPTVLGDFVAGPSHTLPTGGAGRAFSGLRVTDFMRRTSVVEYTAAALGRALTGVCAFAEAENLPAHGRSLVARLGIA